MPLLALPDELLIKILSHIHILERKTLWSIALSSRRLFSLGNPKVYYFIDLCNSFPGRLKRLLRTLDESPERGELVREISLGWGVYLNRGPSFVFNILRRLPMLHTLFLRNMLDPSYKCEALGFPDECPMAFLRSLTISSHNITAVDVVHYTTFPSLKYLEVIGFSGKCSRDGQSSDLPAVSTITISQLKYVRFRRSEVPQPYALENILSRLGRLERLDWEFEECMEPELINQSISDRLIAVSQTLVELSLCQSQGSNTYMTGPLIDFSNFKALEALRIDDRFLFSFAYARDLSFPNHRRHNEEMEVHHRLPPLLRKLEICLNSGAYALGSPRLAQHDFRWIINLAERFPSLRTLGIIEDITVDGPRTSAAEDFMELFSFGDLTPLIEWKQPDEIKQIFVEKGVKLGVMMRLNSFR